MADITMKANEINGAVVALGEGEMEVTEADALALIENAKAEGLTIRVYRQGRSGYKLNFNIEQAAIDASGLSNFKAEKQFSAQGYIEF